MAIIKQNTDRVADAISAKVFRGGAPDFNAPSPAGAIKPERAMKGELKPRIPKPRAISAKPPHVISPAGAQPHYKPRGTY